MIKAVTRWRVEPGKEEAFAKAWEQTAKNMKSNSKGSQGAFLIRSRREPQEFIATSSWKTYEDWMAFMRHQGDAPLLSAGQMISAEVFDDVQEVK